MRGSFSKTWNRPCYLLRRDCRGMYCGKDHNECFIPFIGTGAFKSKFEDICRYYKKGDEVKV